MAENIGQQWQPTCSKDGMDMEDICCRCQNDAEYQAGTGDSCEIAAAMYRDGGNSHWLVGLDGKPFCTKFKSIEAGYRCPVTKDMFRHG